MIDYSIIDDFVKNNISKREFIKLIGWNPKKNPEKLYNLMQLASEQGKFHYVEKLMDVCRVFELDDEKHVEELNRLLSTEGHQRHEDIAFKLELIKSPKSINVLYETALRKFDYLEYNDSQALARKCIWGLGEIGTEEAFEKLKLLANTEDDYLSSTAKKQLKRRGIVLDD